MKHKVQIICINRMSMEVVANRQIYNRKFLLIVKAVTLIFISGLGSAISSAKQGKSGSIYYAQKFVA